MSENQPLSLAEKVRLAKERMAQGAATDQAPAPTSNLYSEDETKLVSDQTAERLKNAGALAALAGKAVLEKSREATQLAKDKAQAMAEQRARDAEARARQQAEGERARAEAAAVLAVSQASIEPGPVAIEEATPTIEASQVDPEPTAAVASIEPEVIEPASVAPTIPAPVAPTPRPTPALAEPLVVRDAPGVAQALPEARQAKEDQPRASNRKRWILVAGTIGILIAVGVGFYLVRGSKAPAKPGATVAQPTQQATPAAEPVKAPPVPVEVEPAPAAPDMSAPVPEVEREPASAYGMDAPEPATQPAPAEPAAVAPAPKPTPIETKREAVVQKPKPVQAPAPRKTEVQPATQERKDWQNKASQDLDALERQLGG